MTDGQEEEFSSLPDVCVIKCTIRNAMIKLQGNGLSGQSAAWITAWRSVCLPAGLCRSNTMVHVFEGREDRAGDDHR